MMSTDSHTYDPDEELREMCCLAAKGLLENGVHRPALVMDDVLFVPVDFRVDAFGDVRQRFERSMMALFERRKDCDRFDACGIVKRDRTYGVTVRFALPNFSARFFPKQERPAFFQAMAVREVAVTIASHCSSERAMALEKRFPDPRSPFERAIRVSVGQYGAIPWKSKAERGEMSRHLETEAHGPRVNGSSAELARSSILEQLSDHPPAGKLRV